MRAVIAPNVHSRIASLDVLRGMAVLGILLANIPAFSGPVWAFLSGSAVRTEPTSLVEALTLVFVTGKFRTPLAILFGAGLMLQFMRRSPVPRAWPGGYVKRTLLLAGIGGLHMLLLWSGDILFAYAMTALIVLWFAPLNQKTLGTLATLGIVVSMLIGAGLALLFNLAEGQQWMAEDSGWITAEEEIRAFGQGSFADQLALRAKLAPAVMLQGIFFAPLFAGYFLLGMWLSKMGFFQEPAQHRAVRNWLLWLGLGIGLPLNLINLTTYGKPLSMGTYLFAETVAGPLLGIGYLTLAAILVSEARSKFASAMSQVGKMSLTAYLAQSVIASAIYYNGGLGLFNRTTALQDLGIVLVIWGLVITICSFWMRHFTIGPVEWAWRSLTEGRRLEWKSVAPREGPPPTTESSPKGLDSSSR
jgi:uncharacterized protein